MGSLFPRTEQNRTEQNRTESSLSSLIHECMRCDKSNAVLSFLKEMQRNGHDVVYPVKEHIIVSILKSCAKLRDKEMGSEIHEYTVQTRLSGNLFIGTAIIDMYAKCGATEQAREVFNSLPVRNVVSWNALIGGYSQHDQGKFALDCYVEMRTQAIPPDGITFSCTLKACASIKDVDKGREIHADVLKIGVFETNQFVGNALVDMYSKCGLAEEARLVFDKLPSRDIVSWNALIVGYVECGYAEEALECYDRVQFEGITPDVVTFACCLKACGIIGDAERGRSIHTQIQRIGPVENNLMVGTALVDMYVKCHMLGQARKVFNKLHVRDVVSWSALIAGYSQNDRGEEALKCFDQMKLEGITPNGVTLASSLKACGSIGASQKGKEIHDHIEQRGWFKSDQIVGNALIDMYVKCGLLAKAQEVFDHLPTRNVVSWTSLITGYAQLGNFGEALYTFNKMREDDILPNSITFISLLNACSHEGHLDKGQTYFEFMSGVYGIVPELKHHTIMVDLFSRSGQLDRAVATMRVTTSHPNMETCLALLGACRKWKNVDLARDAFELAMQLDDKKTVAYVCMSNIYMEANNSSNTRFV